MFQVILGKKLFKVSQKYGKTIYLYKRAKFRTLQGLISTFVEVTDEKLQFGLFNPPPSPIGLKCHIESFYTDCMKTH